MSEFDHLGAVVAFVAAARAGSFTAAADELGVTKSAVGKSVSRLEDRLGMQLFNRTTRKIALTADGEAYFATCANALDDILALQLNAAQAAFLPVEDREALMDTIIAGFEEHA